MDSTSLRRYALFVGSFILLVLTFFFLIFFTPFLKPIKNNIQDGFYSAFGNKSVNFGGYTGSTDNTVITEFDTGCNIKVKSDRSLLATYSKELNPVLNLNLSDNKDKNNSNIKIICLDPNGSINQFKDNIIKNPSTDPNLFTKLGLSIEQIKNLDNFEFYKIYSQKYSSGCSKSDKLSGIKFLTQETKSKLEQTYNYCAYDNNSSSKGVVEYYLFNKDKTKIYYLRGYDFINLESLILIF
jgi:hypothetical protein